MTAEIIELQTVTTLDLPPERILRAATDANLQSAIVLGFYQDGEEYFASSIASGPEVLWALERAKLKLLQIGQNE